MLFSALSLYIGFSLYGAVLLGFGLYYGLVCIVLPLAELRQASNLAWKAIPMAYGLERPSLAAVIAGLVSGALMSGMMFAVFLPLRSHLFADGRIEATLQSWGAGPRLLVLVFMVMILCNGALEELFWRGYIHRCLKGMTRSWLALAIPSLAFGLQHLFVISALLGQGWIIGLFIFGITAAGCIWAILRVRWGLISSLISHCMVTATYMGAFYWFALKS